MGIRIASFSSPHIGGGRVNRQNNHGGRFGKAVMYTLTQLSTLENLSYAYTYTNAKHFTYKVILSLCIYVLDSLGVFEIAKTFERVQRSIKRGLIS